jgi:hypothetical protein
MNMNCLPHCLKTEWLLDPCPPYSNPVRNTQATPIIIIIESSSNHPNKGGNAAAQQAGAAQQNTSGLLIRLRTI